jgi:hypothetical protein
VLAFQAPLEVLETRGNDMGPLPLGDPWPEVWQLTRVRTDEYAREIRRRIDLVRLAFVLASEGDELFALRVNAVSALQPLDAGSHGWSHQQESGSLSQTSELPSAIEDRLRSSYDLVKDMPQHLDLSTRRLLLAVAERQNPLDGFLDAVVCWESLVGANGETAFRLAAAIAHIAAPHDSEKREDVYRAVKRLYGQRSKAVHGSAEPTWEDAWQLYLDATKYAILIFRKVLSDEALRSMRDAESRSTHVILDLDQRPSS